MIKTEYKAALFAVGCLVFVTYCLITIASQTGPIVLGTEREPDGSVEYLCLFRGCEDIYK